MFRGKPFFSSGKAHSCFPALKWINLANCPSTGTNALFFCVCTGWFNKIWPVAVFRRSLSSPSDRSACVAWLQRAGQWGLQHTSSHIRTRNLEEHDFVLGCECFFLFLSSDANFVSWENFFPEESEWFCRNQAQAFTQDVCLSTMLLHSSFPTGKIPWKGSFRTKSFFRKDFNGNLVRRKNSCWEACWQEHCCWAVCFELSGKDVFRETTGKFLGKDPWQQNFRQGSLARKFKSTPSMTTWFSSRYSIERDWVGKSQVTSCFSYDISLYARFLAAGNFKFRPQKNAVV